MRSRRTVASLTRSNVGESWDAVLRRRSLELGTVLAVLDLESVAWRAVTAGRLTDTIFRINRCGALQPAVAACSSSERGQPDLVSITSQAPWHHDHHRPRPNRHRHRRRDGRGILVAVVLVSVCVVVIVILVAAFVVIVVSASSSASL